MKCRFCGTLLPDNAKFCSKCGQKIESNEQSENVVNSNTAEDAYYREIDDEEYAAIKKKEKEEEREQYEQRLALEEERRRYEEERRKYEEERRRTEQERKKLYEGYVNTEKNKIRGDRKSEESQKGKEKGKKNKIGISVFAYFLIIVIGGFALYRTGIVDSIVSNMNKTSEKKENGFSTSSVKKDKTEEKSDKNSKKDTESATEEKDQKLANTDNSNMNVDACLSPEVYNTVISEDGSFSFGYPKYLFNDSKVNEDGSSYTLSYKENSNPADAQLTIYTEDNQGNALENAKQLYQRFSSSVYKTYFKLQPTRIDSKGMARALIGGSVDSSETQGVYIIAANDGKKNYILKFTYPDPDIHDDYNMIDYVVDCVYRYCSFSGGTYQPRTYEQFKEDDMGTKK